MADNRIIVELELDDGSTRKAFLKIEKKAKKAGKKTGDEFSDGLKKGLSKVTASLALGFAALGAVAFKAVAKLREFGKATAEIATITKGLNINQKALNKTLLQTSNQFGKSAAEQAKSFYQIISAGITDATAANQLLIDANKLAIGGLTSTTSAINLLTSAVNAYGKENLSSSKAADIIFGTVRLGKTTVEELNSSLGQILPVAAQLGITFSEVNSALAALTTKGISTSEAVTQLNSILAAVLKKQDTAKKLGPAVAKAFSLQALQAKGLTKFLKDLNLTLGGSETKLVKLLGRVEGARAILALGSDGFKKLGSNVKTLDTSLGASDEAFNIVNKTLDQKLNRSTTILNNILIELAGTTEGPLVRAIDALNRGLTSAFDNINDFNRAMQFAGLEAELLAQTIALANAENKDGTKKTFISMSESIRKFLGLGDASEKMREQLGVSDDNVERIKTNIERIRAAMRKLLGFGVDADGGGSSGDPPPPPGGGGGGGKDSLTKAQEVTKAVEIMNGALRQGFNDTFAFINKGGQLSADAMLKLAKTSSKALASIGKTFAVGFAQSFASVGAAIAKGENAFEALGKAVLGVLGDIAIQYGTTLFLIGVGFGDASKVGTGLALIALGGFLKAISGGGAAGVSSGGGGGSIAPDTAAEDELSEISDGEIESRRSLEIKLEGTIIDPPGAAQAIAELLTEFGDANDIRVVS